MTVAEITADTLVCGDAAECMRLIEPETVACSIWSPPYHVGKEYEEGMTFEDWRALLRRVIAQHPHVLKPGGFMVVNINDILCFADPDMPKIQFDNVNKRRSDITTELVEKTWAEHPNYTRYQIAELLDCSEQTVQRRMEGNQVRGGKHGAQTRVRVVGGLLEQMALENSLYLYDRRIWVKDPAWQNSRWHATSYKAVDEFEYIYIFWKPGVTAFDRRRLTADEWTEWGSRAVWQFPSVQSNGDHPAKFPIELPTRIIRLLTEEEETVLDPFIGSGTTAVAAIENRRHYIGIDTEPDYVALAAKACAQAAKVRDEADQEPRKTAPQPRLVEAP